MGLPVQGKKAIDATEEAERNGSDGHGNKYRSLRDFWHRELGDVRARESWYAKSASYWEAQPASIEGVLGGFKSLHEPDLRDSSNFLEALFGLQAPPGRRVALDCGAGIGRVTSGVLLHFFQECVDLMEPNERLLDTARKELPRKVALRFFACPLQELRPEPARYDVIWVQWAMQYLPDDELRAFLKRCKMGLRDQGMICIKENIAPPERGWLIDKAEHCLTRTDSQFKALFVSAGYKVVRATLQTDWPDGFLQVMMYALRPVEPVKLWRVVGGATSGGLLVREDKPLCSKEVPRRLATAALVREEELAGHRLRFQLLEGSGPPSGWVSLTLGSAPLLVRKGASDSEDDESLPLSAQGAEGAAAGDTNCACTV